MFDENQLSKTSKAFHPRKKHFNQLDDSSIIVEQNSN